MLKGQFLIVGAALTLATPALAETYTIATFLDPTHIITRFQHTDFAENVREATDGSVDFEVIAGGALLPPTGTLEGIASGVAQVSLFPPSYAPSALPAVNAINDLGWLNPDPYVLSFAYADFNFNENVAKQEWKDNGVLFGASASTPVYDLLCRGDETTLAERRGDSIRSAGSSYSRVMTAVGLTPVTIPFNESYTALERGVLDCVNADLTALISGVKLGDLVDTIILSKFSPYFTNAGIIFSRDFWQDLTEDERRVLLDQAALSMVRLQMAYDTELEDARAWAEANDKPIVEADEELKAAVQVWVDDGMGGSADLARETFGIEDPEALYANFDSYVTKWEGLLEGVDRTDEDALWTLLKDEIFNKVDVSTYGIDD